MEGRRPPRASSMMIARNYARPTPIVSLPLPFRKQEISGDTSDRCTNILCIRNTSQFSINAPRDIDDLE